MRKHGGRQRDGWSFDLPHLHLKSGSLSSLKRFTFEMRGIVARQPLPGYRLGLESAADGTQRLTFSPHVPRAGGRPARQNLSTELVDKAGDKL